MGEVTEPRTAPAFRYGNAQQPLFTEQGPEFGGKLVVAIDIGGAGGDNFLRKAPHLFADRVSGLVQPEIEVGSGAESHFGCLVRILNDTIVQQLTSGRKSSGGN